jgi:transketolase
VALFADERRTVSIRDHCTQESMRAQFCDAMVERARRGNIAFLTGDLGFMALEPLQKALGRRFINAGVSEQNMFSVAAAMCRAGLEVWAYSIAPFCYARPFEQIRNDVAMHGLPVKIVGNGGGYGYGVMGPTHHAIEDYGVILTLPGMRACIPVFDEDLEAAIAAVAENGRPTYLRLGRGEPPAGYVAPPFAPWRRLTEGRGPVVAAVGPLAGTYLSICLAEPVDRRPDLWAVSMLPLDDHPPPEAFLQSLAVSRRLLVAEEHVRRGGVGSELALWLAERGITPNRFHQLCATAHRFDRYGSQKYMRQMSALDPASLQVAMVSL